MNWWQMFFQMDASAAFVCVTAVGAAGALPMTVMLVRARDRERRRYYQLELQKNSEQARLINVIPDKGFDV